MSQPKGAVRQWLPPIPVGDEVLACAYCGWTCPRWYQNQTGPKAPDPGRDGYTRLTAHVDTEHYAEHRKAKKAVADRRRYQERKALRDTGASA